MEKVMTKSTEHGKTSTFLSRQDATYFVMGVFGLFLGRIVLFQFINPAVVSYVSIFLFSGYRFFFIMLLSLVGLFTRMDGLFMVKYIIVMGLMAAAHVVLSPRIDKGALRVRAAIGSGSVFISGLIFSALNGLSLYFVVMAALESVLALSLTFVFHKSSGILDGSLKRKTLNNEELVSLAVLLGGIIAGAADIYIGDISMKHFFCAMAVLVIGYKGGGSLGATAGVLLSFVLAVTGFSDYISIGILSMSGLFAGLFRRFGKAGSIAGFLTAGIAITMYLDREVLTKSLVLSNIAAAGFFFFMPDSFYFNFGSVFGAAVDNTGEYLDKVREVTVSRLENFARSFKNLAGVLQGLSEKRTSLNQNDIAQLIDDVAVTVCDDCEGKNDCWEKNFYNTYQAAFSMLGACESKQSISSSDIPDDFKKRCGNITMFADKMIRIYELYKTNLIWNNKISESRELVSEQLLGVSKIIGNLSRELSFEMNFIEGLEAGIIEECNKNKIEVDSVIVLENKQGKYEVTLNHKACHKRRVCAKDIIPLVSGVLGRKMKKEDNTCGIHTNGRESMCKIRMVEEQKLRMTSGVSRAAKDETALSGDSYSFMDLRNGQCILALSDGMGSGKKAREESAAVVELLEDFIDSGFDKETAIKMINSVLVLKNGEESFSTLDICAVDLYTGVAEFIKIGAAATFLIRNKEVSIVKSSSLPMGILDSVDLEVSVKKLRDNDVILMITDGVMEAFDNGEDKERNVAEFLRTIHCVNPQEISDYVLEEARRLADGVVKDDMTALAARLWEKV